MATPRLPAGTVEQAWLSFGLEDSEGVCESGAAASRPRGSTMTLLSPVLGSVPSRPKTWLGSDHEGLSAQPSPHNTWCALEYSVLA